jgi:hypothetical protein
VRGLTAPQMEEMLSKAEHGQGWLPIEEVLLHVKPQPDLIYKVGMMAGRVDLFLGYVCRN